MGEIYIAHRNGYTNEIQTVREHCENTANLCKEYAIPEMEKVAYAAGKAHDIGKYQEGFQRRIRGENIRVEHSTCGAIAVGEKYPKPMNLMMQYCIAGHHTGIPNGGFEKDEDNCLQARMNRTFEDYDAYKKELELPELDIRKWQQFLAADCGRNADWLIDKFAFLTRYLFSCLVDADSTDTAEFCRSTEAPRKLQADFGKCLEKINVQLQAFEAKTELQKTRSLLQEQAYRNSTKDAHIYLMNMPTGSGKTLASAKIALQRAIAKKKKRIIYVIPYNSIIDQTAEVFEKLFENNLEILRHQSTFSYDEKRDLNEDYREAAKIAVENWDAPFIITTAVQFFESIYSNKRGKLRKLHNMADSILIFDEAHMMPKNYLQPCLQGIAYITKYLNSEAVFLTATMPDFEKLLELYAPANNRIENLIKDKTLFEKFQKCQYINMGKVSPEALLTKSEQYPSRLIIVNKKKNATELFRMCRGRKYHLSTYMTVYDRQRVLQAVREELKSLDEDFSDGNVPEERRITIISTSLIEAGVDLDVHTVFRELNGLDSILQSGGRCNREGKRDKGEVFVFEFENEEQKDKMNITQRLLKEYKDISQPECIEEYYEELFFLKKEDIQKNTMHTKCRYFDNLPFQTYSEQFELIPDRTCSIVVPRDEKSRKLVDTLRYSKIGNEQKLQKYTCTVAKHELDELIKQHVADDFGTGIYCLTNEDYYDENLGILLEAQDYFL